MPSANQYVPLAMLVVAALITGTALALRIVVIVGVLLPASVLVFPLVYVLVTTLIEVYGTKATNRAILVAALCVWMTFLFGYIAQSLPAPHLGQPGYQGPHQTLSLAQFLWPAAGGSLGFVAGHVLGTGLVRRPWCRSLYARVTLYPLVAQSVAGVALVIGAYHSYDHALIASLAINRTVFSVVYAAASAPLIYLLVALLRAHEHAAVMRLLPNGRA